MSDAEAIRAVLRDYYEGARDGDLERVRGAFHPGALMSGYLQGQLLVGTPQPFFDVVRDAPAPARSGEPYRFEIVRLEVAGPIASVTIDEGPYLGMQFTEYMHLIRNEGRWQIVSNTFMHR